MKTQTLNEQERVGLPDLLAEWNDRNRAHAPTRRRRNAPRYTPMIAGPDTTPLPSKADQRVDREIRTRCRVLRALLPPQLFEQFEDDLGEARKREAKLATTEYWLGIAAQREELTDGPFADRGQAIEQEEAWLCRQ